MAKRLTSSSKLKRLTPKRGNINAPNTSTKNPRITPFWIEVALKVNVDVPSLVTV